jgi:hypothetical protein
MAMRKLAILLLLLCPRPAKAVASFVQAASATSTSGTSVTATFGVNLSAGSAVVCQFSYDSTSVTISTFRDGNAANFTVIDSTASSTNTAATYYLLNEAGGTATVTVTISGSIAAQGLDCQEASGVKTAAALDVHSLSGDLTGTSYTGTTVTTTAADFCFAGVYDGQNSVNTFTAGTNYSWVLQGTNGNFNESESLVQGTAGNITPQFTATTSTFHARVSIVCLLPATAGASNAPQASIMFGGM